MCTQQSMAGGVPAAEGSSKGPGPLLTGWDGGLVDAAPKSQTQRAGPVPIGGDVLKILSACGQCASTPCLPLYTGPCPMQLGSGDWDPAPDMGTHLSSNALCLMIYSIL
jgi:hypothetical protein